MTTNRCVKCGKFGHDLRKISSRFEPEYKFLFECSKGCQINSTTEVNNSYSSSSSSSSSSRLSNMKHNSLNSGFQTSNLFIVNDPQSYTRNQDNTISEPNKFGSGLSPVFFPFLGNDNDSSSQKHKPQTNCLNVISVNSSMYWRGPYGCIVPFDLRSCVSSDGFNTLTREGFETEMYVSNPPSREEWLSRYTKEYGEYRLYKPL